MKREGRFIYFGGNIGFFFLFIFEWLRIVFLSGLWKGLRVEGKEDREKLFSLLVFEVYE